MARLRGISSNQNHRDVVLMSNRWLRTILLFSLIVLATGACRTRTKPVAPTPVPPTAVEPAPPVTLTQAEDSSQEPSEDPVFRRGIDEINRTAQSRGWIHDAFFAFDESSLDAAARSALERSAEFLRTRPELHLLIEGHCDERGTEQYNLALGDRRANAARDHLITLGIDANRIRAVSYGEERPFATGSNESAWAQNRRAHLVLVRPR